MNNPLFLDTLDDQSDEVEDDDAVLAGSVTDTESIAEPGTLISKLSARARIEQLAEEKALRNATADFF